MSSSSAAGAADVEVGCIRVICKNHSACAIGYYVVGICSYIVEELVDGGCSIFGCSILFGTNCAEGKKNLSTAQAY